MRRWLAVVTLAGACRPNVSAPVASPPAVAPTPTPAPATARPVVAAGTAEPNASPNQDVDAQRDPGPFVMPVPQLPAPGASIVASRIKPGEYECKISREYRFRPCTIALDEHGRSILTIPHALLALQGVLTDAGRRTNFDGIQTDPKPYGCPFCADGCAVDPDRCACKEGPPGALAECVMQPIRFAITKRDQQWRGKIEYHLYHGQPDPEREGGWAYDVDHLSFVMRAVSPPTAAG